jgi:AcrR family transcriptional regulator
MTLGTESERPRRADAMRNRERILEAADAVFSEHGLDAGVGEIATRAGVGRGTLFRNFPSKRDLIAAIVVERMRGAVLVGRELLSDAGDREAVFSFITEMASRQQNSRALFDAVADEFLANPEIRAAHAEIVGVLDELVEAGKSAGTVREDVCALDVLMMLKGVCAATWAFGNPQAEIPIRHLDLIRAAISSPSHPQPLRGSAPTLADFDR